ncbi:hypothetical protein H1P_850023 [Hyella patelloides LEGE 07179]|uniref:Uncharacterized protein n=1 Tax=Hyella patelloides LEGE 07179 TaxID=945734 RepID=A0A563W4S7_9CYAN|nr:hypothetical protein H1P_850023 [Hyella patelloides LEGE 07179]
MLLLNVAHCCLEGATLWIALCALILAFGWGVTVSVLIKQPSKSEWYFPTEGVFDNFTSNIVAEEDALFLQVVLLLFK